jgi:hypothetical protein
MTYSINLRTFAILLMTTLMVLFSSTAKGQTRAYTNENTDYVLDLPSAKWSVVMLSGVAHPGTEFRYGERTRVLLRIRRELVDAGVLPADLVLRQQSSDRVFLRGYVKGKYGSFEGQLSGAKYPYEYISAGKPMAGLIYYLQADNRIIYRLEFTGPPKTLSGLGDQTDFIARSFRLK